MAPVQFAYWVPNVSGGLVVSKVPQRTEHSLEYNVKLAQLAETHGFDYALTQIRFLAGYGASEQHESVTFSHAILAQTQRLRVIAAILPGPWNPTLAAKQLASIDIYTGGRIAVNIVSGWFKREFLAINEFWLDHEERYRRSSEFIQALRSIWTQTPSNFKGDFYHYNDYNLSPKPLIVDEVGPAGEAVHRTHPEIFQGGNSVEARKYASLNSDWFFMNGNTDDVIQKYIADVRNQAADHGRSIKTAINGFVILRETEAEALAQLDEIVNGADTEALAKFQEAVKQAGQASAGGEGMWATATAKDLVQYNEGFRTGLIGTAEQIARRIIVLKSYGVDLVLTAFLHFQDELVEFGEKVIPLVRQYEAEAVADGTASSWPTYENYSKPLEEVEDKKRANGELANGDHVPKKSKSNV